MVCECFNGRTGPECQHEYSFPNCPNELDQHNIARPCSTNQFTLQDRSLTTGTCVDDGQDPKGYRCQCNAGSPTMGNTYTVGFT